MIDICWRIWQTPPPWNKYLYQFCTFSDWRCGRHIFFRTNNALSQLGNGFLHLWHDRDHLVCHIRKYEIGIYWVSKRNHDEIESNPFAVILLPQRSSLPSIHIGHGEGILAERNWSARAGQTAVADAVARNLEQQTCLGIGAGLRKLTRLYTLNKTIKRHRICYHTVVWPIFRQLWHNSYSLHDSYVCRLQWFFDVDLFRFIYYILTGKFLRRLTDFSRDQTTLFNDSKTLFMTQLSLLVTQMTS